MMDDYTDLVEQLLTKSENSPGDSLMDDAAIAIQSQGKRIAQLEAELAALAKQEPVAYINNDRSKFFIPSMEGKEVQHSPYLAHWMVSWDRLYTNPTPSDPGKVTVTTDDHGRCAAVTRTDDDGCILSVIWEVGKIEKPVNARLVEALRLAVKQNSFDMLMTGEELRKCEAALAAEAEPVEPVRLTDNQLQAVMSEALYTVKYPFQRSDLDLHTARCVANTALRANGFKVED